MKRLQTPKASYRFCKAMLYCAIVLPFSLFAQQTPTSSSTAVADSLPTQAATTMSPKSLAIGLNTGLSGAGIDLTFRFHRRLAFQLGYNYASMDFKNFKYALDGQAADINLLLNGGINLSNIPALLNFSLTKRGGIRLVGGINYLLQSDKIINMSAELEKEAVVSDITVTPADFGSMAMAIGNKSAISPYLGIGFGKVIPKKRLSLALDFGTYYRGNYVVTADIKEGILSDENKQNADVLQRNLNQSAGTKWIPQANLRIGIRLF